MSETAVAPGHPVVAPRGPRDPAVDLVKAAALVIVVIMHAHMAGVTRDADGSVVVTNALAGHPVFAWATWALQVMPLFFALGGFSSYTEWCRMRAAGATAADYLRQRANRLARPALLPIALVGGTLAVFTALGYPTDVIIQSGFMMGQPLWFLAVYLVCNAFVPLMARLHDRAPLRVLGGLLLAAVIVDTIDVTFHVPGVATLNFVFVWLFLQQLGFFGADGSFARLPRGVLAGGAVASYALLFVLTTWVGYPRDMYENLNPATSCIVVLGVGQFFLVWLLRPWITRHAGPRVMRVANTTNANSLVIYLWHVPILVLVALVMLGLQLPMPEPLSGAWWATRAPYIAVALIVLVGVVALVNLWRRRFPVWKPANTPLALGVAKTLLAVAGVVGILLAGYTPWWHWAISLGLIAASAALEPWWRERTRV